MKSLKQLITDKCFQEKYKILVYCIHQFESFNLSCFVLGFFITEKGDIHLLGLPILLRF